MKVGYEIDSMDWSDQSGHEDRDRCVDALGDWFEKLDQKTQLAIFYAQQYASDNMEIPDDHFKWDPMNDGCPGLKMLFDKQEEILNQHAPWVRAEGGPTTGYNFDLYAKLKDETN